MQAFAAQLSGGSSGVVTVRASNRQLVYALTELITC